MRNLFEQFAASAGRVGARVAVELQRRDRVDSYTYAELARLADRAADWLAARGYRPGDRLAILADNDHRFCAACLAVWRLGAVAVPLDTTYTAAQVAALVRDCRPRACLTTLRHLSVVAAAAAALDAAAPCEPILLAGRADGVLTLDDVWAAEAAARRPSPPPPCPAGRDDVAVILYTSGTTSDPKGVMLTHGNLLAESEAAFRVVRVDERDAVLGVLPLFHALALLANLLLPFAVGARVVFLETVNTAELLRALTARKITAFCCVPQFFYLLHRRVMDEVAAAGRLERLVFRSLLALNGWLRAGLRVNIGPLVFARVHKVLGRRMRLLVTGGSRFDPAVGRDLYRLGVNILQAYGLTECAGAATLTRPGDPQLDAVGCPLPGVEIRILPAGDGREPRRDGEIAIRGPIVMAGYYGRPDATAAALVDGWLRTGDLGYLDGAGRLHITGRRKEVIVLASGKNVYPEDVEAHYRRSPFIREVCVVGLTSEAGPAAERLHGVVVPDLDVLRDKRIANVGELLRFEIEGLSVQLPPHQRLHSYEVSLEPLPRTTTGKVKRFEVARRVGQRAKRTDQAERGWSASDAVWAAEPDVALALRVVREAVGPAPHLFPDAHLELDLGLDSMARVELIARLEQTFGTALAPEAAAAIFTLRELVEAVRGGRPQTDARQPRDSAAAPVWADLLASPPGDDAAACDLARARPVAALVGFVLVKVLWLLWRTTLGLRVRGREHLPADGPFLISPNHQSYLDAFVLVSALPFRTFRRLFFVGASEYFDTPLRRRLARLANIVPVDPDQNLLRAMQVGAWGLRRGRVLVLFPEGERSIDGAPRKFKKGAAILATHVGVPIVPVALDGLYEVWPRGRSFRWRAVVPFAGGPVTCRFGAPLAPPLPDAGAPDAVYERHTAALFEAVTRMWAAERRAPAPGRSTGGILAHDGDWPAGRP